MNNRKRNIIKANKMLDVSRTRQFRLKFRKASAVPTFDLNQRVCVKLVGIKGRDNKSCVSKDGLTIIDHIDLICVDEILSTTPIENLLYCDSEAELEIK